MDDLHEGEVVIVSTGQAGTVVQVNGNEISVLLRNGDYWRGKRSEAYRPMSKEELDLAKLNVDRLEIRVVRRKNKFD